MIKRLVVWWRAKKAIYGGSNELHGRVFVIHAVFLPCGGVETFKFSSSLDMSSVRSENFMPTGLDSHSVNNKVCLGNSPDAGSQSKGLYLPNGCILFSHNLVNNVILSVAFPF